MEAEIPFYKICLEQELARRCERNTRYSLRAFAKALEIDVGNLSRVLQGKSVFSSEITEKILSKLDLLPEERVRFVESMFDIQKTKKLLGLRRHLTPQTSPSPSLDIELFRVIGDWYHVAIMELSLTENFKDDPKWIAKKLGISPLEAKLAVERLLKLELLERKNGKVQKTNAHITTKDKHLTTPALRKLQKQILEKAIFALENTPIEIRNQSAMTMAIDPSKLHLAKKMIEEFTNTLCRTLETGKKKKVYQLSVSLFPLETQEDK